MIIIDPSAVIEAATPDIHPGVAEFHGTEPRTPPSPDPATPAIPAQVSVGLPPNLSPAQELIARFICREVKTCRTSLNAALRRRTTGAERNEVIRELIALGLVAVQGKRTLAWIGEPLRP